MKVNTIYPAFMGEVNKFGIGAPCVFVRTAGCNLRCYYKTLGILCDTPEALEGTCGEEKSVEEIITEVRRFKLPLVCLTGGEPLLQDRSELLSLFAGLAACGICVVVETNGSVRISPYVGLANVSFVVDYKSFSTGEQHMMATDNWKYMTKDDWLKFVIYNDADITAMFSWCDRYNAIFRGHVSAGVFWGTENVSYLNLLKQITRVHPEFNIHLNMQTHKMVWMYENNLDVAKKIIAPKDL